MQGIRELRGCGTAMVTPFLADGALDEAALARHVDFQIDGGVDFLVPCGTTGETPTLSQEEQLRVVSITLERAAGRVPVIAGAGGNSTRALIAMAEKLAALGVDGLLSVTPYYNKPTQEGLYQHYAALARSVDCAIVLYNVPGRTGCNLLPETVVRLAEITNVIGIKEASGSIGQITDVAVRMPDGFRLLSGDDNIILPLIAVGGCGVISVASNIAPAMMSEFTALCLAGQFDQARQRQGRIQALARGCFLETNPIPAKAALALMGRMGEHYRLPMVPMQADRRRRLQEILVAEGVLRHRAVAA